MMKDLINRMRNWWCAPLQRQLDRIIRKQDTQGQKLADAFQAFTKVHDDKFRALYEYKASLETVGIARKFGGVIDVDYDRLLNSLGHEGEVELYLTLLKRADERFKSARTEADMKKEADLRKKRKPAGQPKRKAIAETAPAAILE